MASNPHNTPTTTRYSTNCADCTIKFTSANQFPISLIGCFCSVRKYCSNCLIKRITPHNTLICPGCNTTILTLSVLQIANIGGNIIAKETAYNLTHPNLIPPTEEKNIIEILDDFPDPPFDNNNNNNNNNSRKRKRRSPIYPSAIPVKCPHPECLYIAPFSDIKRHLNSSNCPNTNP
jgi:hypothetical protein